MAREATWTRLGYGRGPWGLRIAGKATEHEIVSVERRDGSRELRAVGRVVWTGERDGVPCTLAHAGDLVPMDESGHAGDVVPTASVPTEAVQIGPGRPGQSFRIGETEVTTTLHRMFPEPAPIDPDVKASQDTLIEAERRRLTWHAPRSATPHADRARARKAARSGGVRTTPGFDF